jgi:pimeloyl-ACP methyl ester carboxylesterase
MTKDDSIRVMALRILATTPKTFSLAGLSMGIYVAQKLMRLEPDRVERLALLHTSAKAGTENK